MELIEINHNQSSQQAKNLINKLSASEIIFPVSYLFFLNAQGRYVADVFLIEQDALFFAAPKIILERLVLHIKKFDLRNELIFKSLNVSIAYTLEKTSLKDPRNIGYFTYEKGIDKIEYTNLLIENEIAEFEDFEPERSIILEFGKVAKFISHTKGCYPGQELMHRTHAMGQIRKTVKKVADHDTIVRVLKSSSSGILALVALE